MEDKKPITHFSKECKFYNNCLHISATSLSHVSTKIRFKTFPNSTHYLKGRDCDHTCACYVSINDFLHAISLSTLVPDDALEGQNI
jgi:hypothetical protein